MTALKLSSDRKTSPLVKLKPSGEASVKVRNAFGLPAHESCPGQTPFCVDCYAVSSERYPSAGALVRHNLATLREARTVPKMAELLRVLIADYRREAYRAGVELTFRIHWDGDFYSVAYAKAWAVVVRENPDIAFWCYTRSFRGRVNVVPVLAGIENLALYLSVDEYNARAAQSVLAQYPGVLVAACDETVSDGADMLADLGRSRAPACPENVKRIPLVVAQDRRSVLEPGDTGRGACDACGLCINGRADVRFATTNR